jgi:hypothetical protein
VKWSALCGAILNYGQSHVHVFLNSIPIVSALIQIIRSVFPSFVPLAIQCKLYDKFTWLTVLRAGIYVKVKCLIINVFNVNYASSSWFRFIVHHLLKSTENMSKLAKLY